LRLLTFDEEYPVSAAEHILIAENADAAVRDAADHIVAALAGTGTHSIALAGGSTPKSLYGLLAQPPYRQRVDWSQVEFFWGDERCVPPDHADSNYRMARETLLAPLGISDERVHRMLADAADLTLAATEYERVIREWVPPGPDDVPAFDLILLGRGNDGHTASLFPGSAGLNERTQLVVAHSVPALGVQRMTLTYPLLRAARTILFLVTGSGKADVLVQVLSPANDSGLPSAALRPSGEHAARGKLIWILDSDAASRLRTGRP
jgi:6-phosphogluconolactonase